MPTRQSSTALTHGSTSLHARLHKHLDEYEQEFRVRNKTMDEYLQNNIQVLRTVIDETIGEAHLLDRFTKSIASMRTWQDIFYGIFKNDLTIKYYMSIVVKHVGKDQVIEDLEKKYNVEVAKNNALEARYESQLQRMQELHTQQLQQADRAYKKMADLQQRQLDTAKQEMQIMKKQLQILQERILQGDSQKISALAQQNIQQLQVIVELQRELSRYRPKALGSNTAEPKSYQPTIPHAGEKATLLSV